MSDSPSNDRPTSDLPTSDRSTIVALASGRPPAAVAVVRVSGPQALDLLTALTGPPGPPRRLLLRRLADPLDAAPLDDALVVAFPGPASATGEDMAEFHLHGGPAVIAGVLAALTRRPGVRLAEPGEFSRRAFDNGKLDLAQAEGIAELVAAETAAQRSQALALAGGLLGKTAEAMRHRILALLAEAEAALDFGEEEADVAAQLANGLGTRRHALAAEIAALLADSGRAARLRDGLTIAVVGPPNVGKSSLVNALTGRDVAIVATVPGTTRDAIETPIDLGGVAAMLIDTAGLRDTDDPVEAEGIARARARAASADLVLSVSDGTTADVAATAGDHASTQRVVNKIDLARPVAGDCIGVSALTGQGLGVLRDWLVNWARQTVRPGEPALIAHERHKAAFQAAHDALVTEAVDPVLLAEQLRLAAHALGSVAGRVGVEDVLDRIFNQFCIGK